MKPDIENLKVWMSGRSTTGYQRALGVREFEKLLEYVAELEQLRQPLVMRSVCCNSQLVNFNKDYDQCFVCEKIQKKQTDA